MWCWDWPLHTSTPHALAGVANGRVQGSAVEKSMRACSRWPDRRLAGDAAPCCSPTAPTRKRCRHVGIADGQAHSGIYAMQHAAPLRLRVSA